MRIQYNPKHDYYQILDVEPNADAQTLQQAYRARAKQLHPDLNLSREEWAKEQFQLLNEAYSVLNDPESRRIYDNLRWPHQVYQDVPHPRPRVPYEPPRQRYKPPPPTETWLERYHLGWLQPLASIIQSPYRYILFMLGFVLSINVVLIMGFSIWGDALPPQETPSTQLPLTLQEVISGFVPTRTLVSTPVPTITLPTFTPRPLHIAIEECGEHIEIFEPLHGATISQNDAPLPLRGKINHPEFFTFQVEAIPQDLGFLPILLREPGEEKHPPIADTALTWLDPLLSRSNAVYEIKVTVFAEDQRVIGICSILIRKI